MKLIDNASQWHRLWSMRLMILTTVYTTAAGAWVLLPADWQPHLSDGVKAVLAIIGVLLPSIAAVSRLVAQPKVTGPDDTDKAGA